MAGICIASIILPAIYKLIKADGTFMEVFFYLQAYLQFAVASNAVSLTVNVIYNWFSA